VSRADWTPEYTLYHKRVVDACCDLMGQHTREFFDHQCDYFDELAEGLAPDDVAIAQQEALS